MAAIKALTEAAHWFEIDADGFGPLLDRASAARVVLIGEASHGTDEFYRARAELSKALITRAGFNIVALEADWPDVYRAHRWAVHASTDATADTALSDIIRFPRWMWRNTATVDFLQWLREHNSRREPLARTGLYGLDMYSLHSSMAAVVDYLQMVDPAAAARARHRYGCFEDFGEEPQAYGHTAAFDLSRSCEDEVVTQLVELRRRAADYVARDGRVAADEYFTAERNAQVVRSAEQYYRAMFGGRIDTWNLRDTHMMETLEALVSHLERSVGGARVIVWAHNSHLGDARATEMGEAGQLNLGQLVRQEFGTAACLIGFTTHSGTVTAASDWGAPAQRMHVRPSRPDSYERLFHETGTGRLLLFPAEGVAREVLLPPRLQRAIGVIYRPRTERVSHYFQARLPEQFDAVMHIDETHALEPLEPWSRDDVDLPETYPSAL